MLFAGYLWAGAFVWWVINLTEWRVNPETWLDCKLDWFLFYFFGQCSSTTLVVMTAEKCFALYFPLKARYICTVRSAQWTSVVMVTVFLVYNSQSFFVMKKFQDDLGFDYCKTVHTPKNYMKTFHLVHSVIYSYVPIVSMAMLNVALCRKLRQSAKVSVALSGSSGNVKKRKLEKSRETGNENVAHAHQHFHCLDNACLHLLRHC